MISARSIEEVQEVVRSLPADVRLLPVGGGTKSALSRSSRRDVEHLDTSALSGIIEYDPAELTITALAGTPVREVESALAEHHQYLPFDPPLVASGSTLGGAVASGASGPGAWRHGGLRDFVIGVRFVDGSGNLIRGGGKVVKNAAGFDLPKLLVGSIGRLGVIEQLSLKVFPRPAAAATVEFDLGDLERAVSCATAIARGPIELDALEIFDERRVLARIGGRAETLEARVTRLTRAVHAEALLYSGADESALWGQVAELPRARSDDSLIRVGLTSAQLLALHRELSGVPGAQTRYGIGCTVAWIMWPSEVSLDPLDEMLQRLGLVGMVLIGPSDHPLLGPATGGAFGRRVTQAFDPDGRFLEI